MFGVNLFGELDLGSRNVDTAKETPRSRVAPLAVNACLTTRDRTVYNWLPISDQSLAGVLAWHQKSHK